MLEQQRKAVTQGAGLGFLLSALLFVFTWSPLAFLAVAVGAAVGYVLGRPAMTMPLAQPDHPAVALNILARWLAHPRLPVRFACLAALGALLFLLAWTVGYGLLPEGALRASAQAQLESRGLGGQAENAFTEGWKIFTNNLLPFALIVLANLVIRANGVPIGYIIPLYAMMLYGLFLGTNSFAIPYPERMAPSLAILGRAGPYEMLALLLAAASSARWSYYQVPRLFVTAPERAPGLRAARACEFAALIAALLLLAAAAYIEGAMIVTR